MDKQSIPKAEIGLTIVGVIIFLAFLYLCYYVTKELSYSFFYEDMVKQTIQEMVKPGYLK